MIFQHFNIFSCRIGRDHSYFGCPQDWFYHCEKSFKIVRYSFDQTWRVILLIRHDDALFLSSSTINFVWIIAVFGGWSSARIKALKEPPVVIPLYSVSDICKLEIEILIWPEYDVPRCSRWDVRWFAAPPAPLSSECLNVSTQNFGFESPTHHIPSSGPESKEQNFTRWYPHPIETTYCT